MTELPMVTSGARALAIRSRLGRKEWGVPRSFGPSGWAYRHRTEHASVIVTAADLHGTEWLHASMTRDGRVPTYEDLCTLHRAVWGETGYAYQAFVPPASHVNLHEHALHLWGRADGTPVLPDFGATYGGTI